MRAVQAAGQLERGPCGRRESSVCKALKEHGVAGTWGRGDGGATGGEECAVKPRGRRWRSQTCRRMLALRAMRNHSGTLSRLGFWHRKFRGHPAVTLPRSLVTVCRCLRPRMTLLPHGALVPQAPVGSSSKGQCRLPGVLARVVVSSQKWQLFLSSSPSLMAFVLPDTLPSPAQAQLICWPRTWTALLLGRS